MVLVAAHVTKLAAWFHCVADELGRQLLCTRAGNITRDGEARADAYRHIIHVYGGHVIRPRAAQIEGKFQLLHDLAVCFDGAARTRATECELGG